MTADSAVSERVSREMSSILNLPVRPPALLASSTPNFSPSSEGWS
jgi:hypothetical protein